MVSYILLAPPWQSVHSFFAAMHRIGNTASSGCIVDNTALEVKTPATVTMGACRCLAFWQASAYTFRLSVAVAF